MSHNATNWAIRQRGIKPAAKIILWHLADCHHPEHGCFPSQRFLAKHSEMSERAVRGHLADLELRGLIRRVKKKGDSGQFNSDHYILGFEMAPAAESADGRNTSPPAAESGKNQRQILPPIVVKKPLREPIKDPVFDILIEVVSPAAATSFIAYREKIKKPLTEVGAKRLVDKLKAINDQGGDANDALGMAEEKGWQSIEVDWYFKTAPNPFHRTKTGKPDQAWLLQVRAQTIREAAEKGLPGLVRMMSAYEARECIEAGLITAEQCEAAEIRI